MTPILFVGNHNYSSWSLRPWLCLTWAGIAFEERFVDLDQAGYGGVGITELKAISPNGKVPVLEIAGDRIWDSVAIAEWAAETSSQLLPASPVERALVRSAVAEMHSSFTSLRRDLPMNIRRRCRAHDLPADTLRDLDRLNTLWEWGRRRFGARGPYLFGERTVADAFYLPVAARLRTYAVTLASPLAQQYGTMLLEDTGFRAWEARILAQPHRIFSQVPLDAIYAGTDL
jgi:glutathione S-transferase